MEKKITEVFGLIKGQKVEITDMSGHNGESFIGTLTEDVEIGKPILVDGPVHEITDEISEVSPDGKDFALMDTKGTAYILVKIPQKIIEKNVIETPEKFEKKEPNFVY